MVKDLSEVEKIHHELNKFSSNYYRNNFRRAAAFLLLIILLNAILVGILGYLYVTTPPKEITAISVVPPPISTTILPEAS